MSGKILWSDRKRTIFGLPWSFTKYKCTSDKLLIETGLLNKKEDEIRLYRILDITLVRPFSQRIFGLGTIHCCSADKTAGEFDIKRIKNSVQVKDALSDLIEEALAMLQAGESVLLHFFHKYLLNQKQLHSVFYAIILQ